MTELKASIVLDLAGNLQRQAARYSQSLQQFASSGNRHLGMLRSSTAALNRGLDQLGNRYTALITGAAGLGAAKGIIDFDAELKQLAVDADISDARLAKVKQQLLDTANAANIRVDRSSLLMAAKEITARTGDINVALDNLGTIGLAIRATGAEGRDASSLIANFYEKFQIKTPQDLLNTLDLAAKLGKAGAFELRDLATEGNAVSAAYAATGRVGGKAAQEMLAMLQVIRRTAPSAAEAAGNFERLISTLTAEKVETFTQNGIKIWDETELAKGNKVARAVPAIILDILKATNADPEKLAKVFDIRALRAVNAFALEFRETGGLPSIDQFMSMSGDGSQLLQDAARNASTAKAAVQSLQNAGAQFADQNLAKPIQELADLLNSLKPEEVERYFEAAKRGVLLLGGAIVASKVIGGVASLGKLRGGKSGGGAAGALAGAAGGPIPVYVVNLGAGGDLLGGPGSKSESPSKKAARATATRGGKLMRMANGAGRALPWVAGAASAYQLYDIATSNNSTLDKVDAGAAVVGGLGGGLGGAKLGALIGTALLPGIGTLIGGALGGLGGYLVGELAGDKFGDWITAKDTGTPVVAGQVAGAIAPALQLPVRQPTPLLEALATERSAARMSQGDAQQIGKAVADALRSNESKHAKVVVEVNGPARVHSVSASGIDLEALGPTMVGD